MHQKGRPKNNEIDKKIMTAVQNSLEKNDIQDFSLETVIKEAGIAKQSLYNRFGSKLELLLQYLNYLSLKKVEIKSSLSSVEKICAVLFPAVDYASSKNSSLLKLLAMESLKNKKHAELIKNFFINERRNLLIEVIDEAKKRQEIEPRIDSDMLCDMLFGLVWYRMIFNINDNSINKEYITNILNSFIKETKKGS